MPAIRRTFAVLLLAAASLAAAQDPPDPPQQTFRSGVNFVRIDVLVTDGDEPVRDLTQDDFEVTEDGKPQTIAQFRLIQVDGSEDPRRPLPVSIRTRDDESMVADRDDVRVFAFFLDDYRISKTNWMEVRDELIRFVRTEFKPNDLLAIMDPTMSVRSVTFTRDPEEIVRAMQAFQGRMGEYLPPRTIFEEQYAHLPPGVVERVRTDVSISALEGLAVRLGSLREGRKAIIYVSERLGVSADSLVLRDVWRSANRHNTAIYVVNPRRLTPFRAGRQSQDAMRRLAEETGGRAVLQTNALTDGLGAAIRDASVYYLLGYSSSSSQNDGKFHEVKVRVKRRGVTVHARKGYWAMTAEDVARGSAPPAVVTPAQRALKALAEADGNRYIYRWVGTERGTDGRTRVTVAWEPKGDRVQLKLPEPERVDLTVETPDRQPLFSGTGPAGAAHVEQFELDPGRREIRLTTRGVGGDEELDRDLVRLDVPDLGAPGGLSTPRVFLARTVREFREAVAGGARISARREFRRSDRLLVRFDVYAGEDAEDVTASLLASTGRKLVDLPVAPATTGGTHQFDVSLAALIPSEYVIEISSGDAVEFVPFRLAS